MPISSILLLYQMLKRHIVAEEVFLDSISDTRTFTTLLGDKIDIVKASSGKLCGWKVTQQHCTIYRMNRA